MSCEGSRSLSVYLVRHGQVEIPAGKPKRCMYGAFDVPLSAYGKLQAEAGAKFVAQNVRDPRLVRVVSSDLQRARFGALATAKCVGERGGNVIEVDELSALREINWGRLGEETEREGLECVRDAVRAGTQQ